MTTKTPHEPTCPDCGNNRQVWDNQISGEKVCHRAGCHKTIGPTPHPLAVEAAEAIRQSPHRGLTGVATIIHTTALEPVIEAGEEMERAIIALDLNKCLIPNPRMGGATDVWAVAHDDMELINQALTQWRTLTSPKTGDSTPLAPLGAILSPKAV